MCTVFLLAKSKSITLFDVEYVSNAVSMSIENGPGPEAQEWKAPERRERNDDLTNAFAAHEGVAKEIIEEGDALSEEEKKEILDTLPPIKTFEEYMRSQRQDDSGEDIRGADSEQAIEFNGIVAEFNADLPRIKEEQDVNAILAFCQRLGEVTKGR